MKSHKKKHLCFAWSTPAEGRWSCPRPKLSWSSLSSASFRLTPPPPMASTRVAPVTSAGPTGNSAIAAWKKKHEQIHRHGDSTNEAWDLLGKRVFLDKTMETCTGYHKVMLPFFPLQIGTYWDISWEYHGNIMGYKLSNNMRDRVILKGFHPINYPQCCQKWVV